MNLEKTILINGFFGNLGPVTGLYIECIIVRMRDVLRELILTLEFVR